MAFNQPLSFDTSSVTNMFQMFMVRALAPSLQVGAPCTPCTPLAPNAQRPSPFPLPPLGPHLASPHTLLSTPKGASAFNQPLSLDMSSVTSMRYMFEVRSARAPHPNLP